VPGRIVSGRRSARRAVWPTVPATAADRPWIDRALRLARAAARAGEVPIGAVVVRDGRILGAGRNRTIAAADPSAHAEIVALRRAGRAAGNHRLGGATLYVTLEPCLMCLGAMVHARIDRLVYGAPDPKVGAVRRLRRAGRAGLNHRFAITAGARQAECAALLRAFFRRRRPVRPAAASPAESGRSTPAR
jgi:tRNA(adenine34) deaminase